MKKKFIQLKAIITETQNIDTVIAVLAASLMSLEKNLCDLITASRHRAKAIICNVIFMTAIITLGAIHG